MDSKKVIIIPDLHHRVYQAEKIIKTESPDQTIFLGDYFDDFNDTPEMVRETCAWLDYSVKQPNRIHCYGNHDIHYAFAGRNFECSGYTQWKYFIIHDTLPREVWDKLKYYHVLDETWLLTHAGLHKFHLPENIAKLINDKPKFFAELSSYFDAEIIKGHRNNSWIFGVGHSRGGMQRVGGIVWCDHNAEMYPVLGLHQIYGHTRQKYGSPSWIIQNTPKSKPYMRMATDYSFLPKNLKPTNSFNLCLDVWMNTHWAVWNGKSLVIKSFRNEFPPSEWYDNKE